MSRLIGTSRIIYYNALSASPRGPLPHVEHLNAQNRLKIITALLFVYNQQLSQIQKPTLYHLCRIASQLVNQGFAKFERPHRSYGSANDFHNPVDMASASKPLPRIPVSSELLLELTHAAYFAMFNEFASVANRTIKDIHRRACFEMLPDVILVTNAVKNSMHANPSGEWKEGRWICHWGSQYLNLYFQVNRATVLWASVWP